ncbi:hypothetical protein XENOCAPTIV_021537, partial [Xenoophorus captivus]
IQTGGDRPGGSKALHSFVAGQKLSFNFHPVEERKSAEVPEQGQRKYQVKLCIPKEDGPEGS